MKEFFFHLLGLSKVISIMIITVMILRMILKKAPKKVHKMLWLIVGLRACLPFYIKSKLGVLSSDVASITVTNQGIAQALPENQLILPNIRVGATKVISTGLGAKDVMAFLWVAGVLLLLLYMLINYIRTKKLVADAKHVKENIYSSSSIPFPFIMGYINPKIFILPDLNMNQQELIVAHERCHLRNKDHILKAIGFILLGVYWFNPLMWLAYFLFCKDVELACDEEVIKEFPFEQRKEYALVLLDCAHNANALIYGVAFNEDHVKERVKSVINYKKPGIAVMVAAVIACVTVSTIFFTVKMTSKQTEYVTYEFDTFEGTTVTIDNTNIISQNTEKDVFETKLVPENAEVIAPGRDYVYLADDQYYYVEDSTRDLLTIASKGNDSNVNNLDEIHTNKKATISRYENEDYSFDYQPDALSLFEDADTKSVLLSYTKEGVETAGSNVITISKVENTDCQNVLRESLESYGGKESDITEISLNDNISKAYVYSVSGESESSGLKTVETCYAIQKNEDVILLDQFRTVGPNEEIERMIDSEFEYVILSFL